MAVTGGCQCGAVRFAITAKPVGLYVCHCRECQKQSASAFGVSVICRAADFHISQGRLNTWSRPTDRGGTLDCHFCAACGSRVWHGNDGAEMISVKGGSFDSPVDLTQAIHIWTSRKLPGVVIPACAAQFPGEPD
jgi:hypothetical protein